MQTRTFYILLGALALLGFGWYQLVTWTQYQASLVFLHDVGVFDVLAAGPRHGHFLRSPTEWEVEANYFAAHFRPILFVIMPLYFVVDHVMTLLTAFNLALALAVVPLVLLANDVLRNQLLALAVGLLYLTNHFVLSIHLAMHPESMAFVGFFGAMLALQRRRPIGYAVCLLWALSVKEDYGLWVGLFGGSLFLRREEGMWRWAAATTAAGFGWWAMTLVVMPLLGQAEFHASGNNPLSIFASMGDTKGEVFLYMLTHPLEMLGRLFSAPFFWVFASVFFIPLLDWRSAWLVLLSLAPFLASDRTFTHNLQYYYSYPAIPFLFYGTIHGLKVLLEWKPDDRRLPIALLALCLLIAGISLFRPTRADNYLHRPFAYGEREKLAREIVRLIPPKAPVAAQFDLFVKVPNRPVKLPLRSQFLDEVEYVFLDELGRIPDLAGEEMEGERRELNRRLWSDEFEIVFEGDGYVLLRRNL